MAGNSLPLATCVNCKRPVEYADKFCRECGQPKTSTLPRYAAQQYPPTQTYPSYQTSVQPSFPDGHHVAVTKGLGQIFGVHPLIIFVTLIIDSMLFSGEVASLGAIYPISIAVSLVLGVITYLAQVNWYRDDKTSALIKAMILALLTAIPTALPAFIYTPAGIVGLVHWFRHRKDPPLFH